MGQWRGRSVVVAATIVVVAIGALSSIAGAAGTDPGDPSRAPLARTTHGEPLSATEAIVFGRFNPRGHRTVIRFEYGPTRSYGHVAPKYVEEEWFGEAEDAEEEILECLRPGTVYHYRIVARNKFGTTHGRDRAFRTPFGHVSRHEECDRRA